MEEQASTAGGLPEEVWREPDEDEANRSVVVRLEGGIGDHVLGMRVLRFVRHRFPEREILILSDAGCNPVQATVAAMSPLARRVIVARPRRPAANIHEMGSLENLDDDALRWIQAAHAFVDAWGGHFFFPAGRLLQVSFLDILANRPEIVPPTAAETAAEVLLKAFGRRIVVAMSLCKHGAGVIAESWERTIAPFLGWLLTDPRVLILNLYSSTFRFSQWPTDLASNREAILEQEARLMESVCATCDRIIAAPNFDIEVVVALLRRSSYFIGVDNGIKHLAWALGIPLTFFHPGPPEGLFALRWMPDVHRLLLMNAPGAEVDEHARRALEVIRRGECTAPARGRVSRFETQQARAPCALE